MLTQKQLKKKVEKFRNELIEDIRDHLTRNNNVIVYENKKVELIDTEFKLVEDAFIHKLVIEDGDVIMYYSYDNDEVFDETYVDLDLLSMDELYNLYQALI